MVGIVSFLKTEGYIKQPVDTSVFRRDDSPGCLEKRKIQDELRYFLGS